LRAGAARGVVVVARGAVVVRATVATVVDVLDVVVGATPVVVGVWVTWSVAETPTAPPPQRTPML